jgi:uncharacterized protein YdeI (YjbR/CyaY-like superfamily)
MSFGVLGSARVYPFSREVDIPEALAGALATDHAAKTAFGRMSYTHRKEYARWIAGT